VSTDTIELPAIGGGTRRGRHARPRRVITPARVTAATAALTLAAAGLFLLAGHPQLPRAAPQCVSWHSCRCRYPGSPIHWNGNRLCTLQHESDATIVVGKAR
jgi:hypothetical protein